MQRSSAPKQAFPAEFAAVYIGGGVGVLLRFGLDEMFVSMPTSWPWPTLIANVLACGVLGFVLAGRESGPGERVRFGLLGTGFCGGLSTFSALQLELFKMIDGGSYLLALCYLAVSLFAGLAVISLARRYFRSGIDLA